MTTLSPDMLMPRIIRKYPNRRLYDTESSTYITLEGVRQLVMDRTSFQVVDKRSGEDITRSILLQIISEEEEGGTPVFGTEVLQQVIRLHGNAQQGVLGEYLKMNVALFVEQQTLFDKAGGSSAVDPIALIRDFTQQNIEFWSSFFPLGSMQHESEDDTNADSKE